MGVGGSISFDFDDEAPMSPALSRTRTARDTEAGGGMRTMTTSDVLGDSSGGAFEGASL